MIWIETFSGIAFDLRDPKAEMVQIVDIAHALARINRFSGHTAGAYSVAQHSVLLSERLPKRYALAGLLHDAAEAYVGDMSSPLRRILPEFTRIHDRVLTAIAMALDVPELDPAAQSAFGRRAWSAVNEADKRMLLTERRDLFVRRKSPHRWEIRTKPFTDIVIKPWMVDTAEISFLLAFRALKGTRK